MLEMDHLTLPEAPRPEEPGLLQEIYQQLGEACKNEALLEHNWVSLGALLLRYRESGQWNKDGFDTFDSFMETLRERFKRGRTQLRSYLGVAEYFLPTISAETLEAIGISNALEMKRQSKLAGKPVPEEIILEAKDLSGKELRARLARAFNIQDDPNASWFDFRGTYYTAEQRQEFKDGVRVAMKVLGIKPNIPDHIARGEIMLAFAREFYGTYAAEVYGVASAENAAQPSDAAWVAMVDGAPVEIFGSHKEALAGEAGRTLVEYPRSAAVDHIRHAVFLRDNYTCTNCGDASLTWASGHMHERVWRGNGGNISLSNSITLCAKCHLDDKVVGHGERKPQWSV